MPETNESTTGTGNPSPETRRGPGRPPAMKQEIPEGINWVTAEEAERYEAMMFKPYIRRRELHEGDNKKFFYQITSMCPYVPANPRNDPFSVAPAGKNLVAFTVQKYHRDKMITRNVFEPNRKAAREVKFNQEARWVDVDMKTGNAFVVDADATLLNMDSREFEKQFVAE